MAENREEILANFQGITAVEDVAEAIFHLEEANWDLLTAINRVMPQEGGGAGAQPDHRAHDVDMIDDDISVITPTTHPPDREDSNQASTSSLRNNSNNTIELLVQYNNKVHEITMPSTATVNDLKKRVECVCGVAVCRQQLAGLGRAPGGAPLRRLPLPPRHLLRLTEAERALDDAMAERLTATYTLLVQHEGREYTLHFPGTKTVREVKNDVYALTDIPARHQQWAGWPRAEGRLDDCVLGLAGLTQPVHRLTVTRTPPAPPRRPSSDTDSSVEEVEDPSDVFIAEDDMFVDLVHSERLQPLMSPRVEDEALGCVQFAARFRARYGPNSPDFFEGTLQDAIKESCLKPAKERKLLGVYLHHERSVLANVFCAQLLGCETVLQTLAANFVVYGWDVTHPDNSRLLLQSVSAALGPAADATVRAIPPDRLPALLIIMRARSTTEIHSVINGNVGVSELMAGLVEAWERWAAQRDAEVRQERERDARQRVKREQDEAYQRSLEADRAKEEIKKQQERERSEELERAESERVAEEGRREAQRAAAAARLPPEPAESDTSGVTRIRVRLPPPHHHCLERRFRHTDTLQALFDFLASKGYPQENYKVISSWPRRDLTLEGAARSLAALQLCPQETVVLEER